MPTLSAKPTASRSVLEEVARARLEEAAVLRERGWHAGAIYLATYAVECWLKIAICHALDWSKMLATFTTHDLELLILHSGLERRMKGNSAVYTNFRKIQDLLTREGGTAIRYRVPSAFSATDAEQFLEWVSGDDGVVTWVKKQL
ncbi:MAG: hypothetical protein JSU63_04370 [Phycisphaerales bacterium]|nr:MAG: hypothetical protein JSU63_04370 [Phycisphaerales bacterium]